VVDQKLYSQKHLEIRALRYIYKDRIIYNWGKIVFTNEYIESSYKKLKFSVKEYKILSFLVNNKGCVVTRESIHYKIGMNNRESRIVDVYINSIRKKIIDITPNEYKKTITIYAVRGEGYIIK